MMYERMRARVENVVKRGSILPDYITNEAESEAFSRWTDGFTPRDHPAVVQVCFVSLVLIGIRNHNQGTY